MLKNPPSWIKPAVDYGPLALFLITYQQAGMLPATAVLMAASTVALLLGYLLTRKLALVPLVTAIIVGVFGGLTLWLQDDSFIKMKPTIVYLLFVLVILGGILTKRPVLKSFVGEALQLDEDGWRSLSWRFVGFFAAMALANEAARALLTTDQWVMWKVGGTLALTFLFMLGQTPLIRKHRLPEENPGD